MHPALSIILFTTLSGIGLGLLTWLGIGGVPDTGTSAIVGFVVTAAGLCASTFHLGHPERAWRALSQWRSSWLSREGVLAIVTLVVAVLWWYLGYPRAVGIPLAAFALLTVFATSMIYAQMKSVRHWNTHLTPAVFILMSLGGGGLAYALCAALSRGISNARTDQSD